MDLLNQLFSNAGLPPVTTISNQGLPAVLSTEEAAAAINRAPQTLRKWACLENGPIRPIRINRRLAWYVSDLVTLLSGDAPDKPPDKLLSLRNSVAAHRQPPP